MKKVMVISGSPRRNGDGARLIRLIEQKVKAMGDAEFTYVFLKDVNIGYCRGCLLCMKKGEGACPLKDDVPRLRDELLSADGVIFASPVYVHHITASLKNFFDRFAYFMHRPAFHGKPALVVSTTEISGLEETVKYLKFPVHCWGFKLISAVGVIADAFKEEGKYRRRALREIDRAAGEFHRAMAAGRMPRPTVHDMQFFNKIKTKVLIHREKLPYDFQFWREKGWLDADYFYETPVNPVVKLLGRLPVRIIKLVMRARLGTALYRKIIGGAA